MAAEVSDLHRRGAGVRKKLTSKQAYTHEKKGGVSFSKARNTKDYFLHRAQREQLPIGEVRIR